MSVLGIRNLRKLTFAGDLTIFMAWTTEAGFPAVARFDEELGVYNGYVGVPPKHPLHGVDYTERSNFLIPPEDSEPVGKRSPCTLLFMSLGDWKRVPQSVFNVHGSINFSQKGTGTYPDNGYFPGHWWFGFDCGHAGDSRHPSYFERMKKLLPDCPSLWHEIPGDRFRDLGYVTKECESLATQMVTRVRKRSLWERLEYFFHRIMGDL